MKKVISVLLLLAMVIGCFAGCTPEVKEDAALNAAAEYLYAMYKDAAAKTAVDYTVVGQVRINDTTYPITWTVDKTENVQIIVGENSMVTIKLTPALEDVNYKLTATLKNADGQAVSVSFDHFIPKADGLPATLADGTYVIVAGNLTMSSLSADKSYGYPTATEVTVADGKVSGHVAADVLTIKNVDGGFTIQDAQGRYFYLKGTYNSFNVDATAPAEGHVFSIVIKDGKYLIQNNLAKKTLAYSTSYSSWGCYADLTDDHTSLVDIVAATAPEGGNTGNSGSTDSGNNNSGNNNSGSSNTGNNNSGNTGNNNSGNTGSNTGNNNSGNTGATGMITSPETGKAYKLSMNNGKDLYFMGVINKESTPWYMKSSENVADAIDVYLEAASGGYRLYFTINGTKTYLVMYKDGTHYSLKLTTEASTVYTWNSQYNTLVAMNEDKECFIGTSGTYNTFSCNTIDKVGSSYVAHLFGAGGTGSSNSGSSNSGSSNSGSSSSGSNTGSNTGSSNTGSSNTGSNTGSGSTSTTNGATLTFDFTGLTVSDSNAIDATTAASLFNNEAVVSVAATKVYQGNPDTQYGAFCAGKGTGAGYLKLSNSSTNGQLVLTFNKKVAKVEIVCHDWYTKSDSYPNNSNKVAVNGGEAQFAPYSTDATPGSLIFNLDGSSETVTIDTSNTTASKGGRIFIFKIIVTFTN